MSEQSTTIISKVWGMCAPLRDDGVSYGDYLEQLTYLIFLKMSDEYSKPPYKKITGIPDGYTWSDMNTLKGAELEEQYKKTLEKLAKEGGILGQIFSQASNKISNAAILFRIVQMIDKEKWVSMSSDVKGEIYEGLLQKNAEDIKSGLYKVDMLIASDDTNLLAVMKECMQTLQSVSKVYTPAQEWLERLESCLVELKDLSHEVSNAAERVEFNPSRLEEVNERLNLIYSLQQKHHVSSVEELLAIEEDYRSKLEVITSSDDRIIELTEQKKELYKKVVSQAAVLTKLRQKASEGIEKQMQAYLVPLGMPNVRFVVELSSRNEPNVKGMDNVTFLFSANKNGSLQQVASIASGGEIARVMLSLKAMIAGAVKLPTIIFDEIDTGVSGSIAEKMALIMHEMGQADRQVISITHLPQIAARGAVHYKVYKEDTETGTNSHILQLNKEERINEIANMLSGATLTEAALNNAKALLNNESL